MKKTEVDLAVRVPNDLRGDCDLTKEQIEEIQRDYWFHYFNDYLFKKGLITEDQILRVENYLNSKAGK